MTVEEMDAVEEAVLAFSQIEAALFLIREPLTTAFVKDALGGVEALAKHSAAALNKLAH